MKCLRMLLAAMAVMGMGEVLAQNPHEFSRYQIILDRLPFGQVGPAAGLSKGPDFAQRFVFVGQVSTTNNEVLAIIQDRTANRNYFKAAGETIDDVKVVSIDPAPAAKLVLQKGLEVATLAYQPRAAATAPPPPGINPPPPSQVPPAAGQPPPSSPRRMPFRR